jgi:hypothetical protein
VKNIDDSLWETLEFTLYGLVIYNIGIYAVCLIFKVGPLLAAVYLPVFALLCLAPVSCVLDFVYVAVPAFREKCAEIAFGGSRRSVRLLTRTDRRTGKPQIRFISRDAVYAVDSGADSVSRDKKPMPEYIKRSALKHILCCAMLIVAFTRGPESIGIAVANFVFGIVFSVLDIMRKFL